MADWQWREDVDIEILTPIRNQIQWLEYLLIMVKRILDKTRESKVWETSDLYFYPFIF